MADKIRGIGIEAELDGFRFTRPDVHRAELIVGDRRIKGVPLFDCAEYTDNKGIAGRLGSIEDPNAEIGVGLVPPTLQHDWTRDFIQAKRNGGFRGMVSITVNRTPGLSLLNGDGFSDPFGPPALQVSSEESAFLNDAMKSRAEATLITEVKKMEVEAYNVVARIVGKAGELPPLVVMTPRSGWWSCASERGGGLAGLLEIMRALKASRLRREVIFTANTGHELGHQGMLHFLRRNPGLEERALAWIHLGANFAAIAGEIRLQASDEEIEKSALDAMADVGLVPGNLKPRNRAPFGEARSVFEKGGRFISLGGNNNLFHHPDDRWPDAVDIDKSTRLVRAFSNLAIQLAE